MPIVPSRSGRIQELLARLVSGSPVQRDAAVAGLALLGPRVIGPVAALLPGAGREARLAAVEVLEGQADRAALPPLLDLARGDDDVVALRALEAVGGRGDARAVPLLARLLAAPAPALRRGAAAAALVRLQAAGRVEALDPLASRLLDEREEPGLRLAILEGLLGQEPPLAASTLRPLLRRLAGSSAPELAARAREKAGVAGVDRGPAGGSAATSPAAEAAERAAASAARLGTRAIPDLLRALDGLGPLRRGRADPASLRARAAVHEALAAFDSRVALYDLREALEARPRVVLPALLRAAARVGDASVVPALARAVSEETALLDACAGTLAAIRARERLRKTSAALRAVRPEHRTAFDLLWEKAKG